MIATGVEMFRREGYQASSWRRLVEQSNTPWGSAYHYFPGGKEQLGIAVIERAAALGLQWIQKQMSGSASAAEGIAGLLSDSACRLKEDAYEAGCPIAIVTLERGSHSPALTKACNEAFQSWQNQIAYSLKRRGLDAKRSEQIALAVLAMIEGSLVIGRAVRSTEVFDAGLITILAALGQDGYRRPIKDDENEPAARP